LHPWTFGKEIWMSRVLNGYSVSDSFSQTFPLPPLILSLTLFKLIMLCGTPRATSSFSQVRSHSTFMPFLFQKEMCQVLIRWCCVTRGSRYCTFVFLLLLLTHSVRNPLLSCGCLLSKLLTVAFFCLLHARNPSLMDKELL